MSRAERVVRRPPTRAEYEALVARVEDLEDALSLRAAEVRGPTVDGLPVELVERMLAGEHPVRIWREHRGLTARALASRAKVDPAYLSQIETGKKPGSVKALRALARALSLDLEDVTP
jgi:DNA-binding XRE family transcriptional regulator